MSSAEGRAPTGNTAAEVGAATGTMPGPEAGPTAVGRTSRFQPRRGLVLELLERFGLVFLLAGEIVLFCVWSKTGATFRTWANFRQIVANQSVLSVAALASILPLIGGSFDLSVGAVALLSDIVCAAALSHHHAPLGVAIVIAVAFGAVIGLCNGLVVAKAGVNALITTLGTFYVIIGLIIWYTNGYSIVSGIPSSLTDLSAQRWLGVPRIAVFMVAAAIVVWYLLAHTPWGRYLQSVGSNPIAARLVGIDIDVVVVISFVLSGTFAAIAGVLALAHDGNASPNIQSASGLLLPALASAFLGATTIRPGRFNVLGTLVAIFFIAVAVVGLTLAGVANWVQYVLYGAALVVAVALTAVIGRRRGRI